MMRRAFWLRLASVLGVTLLCAVQAVAQTYQRAAGEPFFLLSDASYGTQQIALVRLEVPLGSAVYAAGGVDLRVYRIPQPLEFLQKQKNPHRVASANKAKPEGLSNALAKLWDDWVRDARSDWRRVFSNDARRAVTKAAPELRARPGLRSATDYRQQPQFAPLAGFELVDEFRYPVAEAEPIKAPANLNLPGSSSEFIQVTPGNVMVPIGKRAAGLYLVEAMLGGYRATTLVFVSDTMAITKIAGGQLVVWTVQRGSGDAVAQAKVLWSDGVGVLQSGATNAQGLITLTRDSPEHTYVFGEDAAGGVFVTENFYYDSEIYNTKLYAVTDRPLYRPGDEVRVKLVGREFQSARASNAIKGGPVALQVLDPAGFPVATQSFKITSERGADTAFRLPENAALGGYQLRLAYGGETYSAAFRVADYQKPHFEITVVTDKPEYKTGEPIRGHLQLAYPDGKPVKEATINFNVRAQKLTMVEGDLNFVGQFPVQIESETLTTDDQGRVAFNLPQADQPSRYVLNVFATDQAAYRVKAAKEILIERGAALYRVRAERQFSAPKQSVGFTLALDPATSAEGAAEADSWEWVRLEDRARDSGKLGRRGGFELAFEQSGSYSIFVKDARGNVLGGTTHWVSGAGVKVAAGSIEIVFDKPRYRIGEVAEALISFPEEVRQALLSLERDKVEAMHLLSASTSWVETTQVAPTQWRARLRVQDNYGPNITLSVAYVKNGEYAFQNAGLLVDEPRVEIALKADKTVYKPGEKVQVTLDTTLQGKPVAAVVTVSVVDEMIYVLQPEIAPNIFDFFFHPRRNNVRTAASQSFISYDLATGAGAAAPSRRNVNERRVKLLERPRRDNIDTAYWNPALTTDANGKATLAFTMPDGLTRWRITARAVLAATGQVGQQTAYVRSDKPLYVKWTSPDWLRAGDQPNASVAIFNQTNQPQPVELRAGKLTQRVTAAPGANFVSLPLNQVSGGAVAESVNVAVLSKGAVADQLSVPLRRVAAQWRAPQTLVVPLKSVSTPLKLPADAANVRVRVVSGAAAQFHRIADDLVEYPYGCVEQTASRLIPLALAYQNFGPGDQVLAWKLSHQLSTQRVRLAQMAGPNASFGWWRDMSESAFLTNYAYYADWHAARALKLELPSEHWQRPLNLYTTQAATHTRLQRALMLAWLKELGQPVTAMTAGLLEDFPSQTSAYEARAADGQAANSAVLGEDGPLAEALALVLAAHSARELGAPVPPKIAAALDVAKKTLAAHAHLPLARALLALSNGTLETDLESLLGGVQAEQATVDRAVTLALIHGAMNLSAPGALPGPKYTSVWRKAPTLSGQAEYYARVKPQAFTLDAPPPANAVAIVRYDSSEKIETKLPVSIERRFWRVRKGKEGAFRLEALSGAEAFMTDGLYLDEIKLNTKKPQQFGMVEAPLPPGASVESTTWGINIAAPSGNETEALPRATAETTNFGYGVPVETLGGEVVVRHLVRFAQTGRFKLPPVRYYGMYTPMNKAVQDLQRDTIEVR